MEFVPDLPYGSEPLRLGMASSFAAITDWLHNLDEHARDLLGFEHVPDGFGAVRGVSTGGPANFAAISCGSYDNRTAQVVGIGDDGRLYHTVRHQDGTWQATMGALAAVSLDGAAAYSSIGAVGAGAGVPPAPPSPPVPTAQPPTSGEWPLGFSRAAEHAGQIASAPASFTRFVDWKRP